MNLIIFAHWKIKVGRTITPVKTALAQTTKVINMQCFFQLIIFPEVF